MRERRSAADLGSEVEASLSAFPFPERDWEKDASAALARLSEVERGSTEAQLLAAPLPTEPGEPATWSATTTPLTHSGVRTQSLAEMARRSVQQKQSEERELLRASLALAAQTRPQSAPAVAPREAVNATRALDAAAVSPPSAQSPASARGATRVVPWARLALGAGALALAAAVLLRLRAPAPEPPVGVATVETAPAQARAQSPAPTTPTASSPERAPAAVAAAPGAQVGVNPDSLAQESAALAAGAAESKRTAVTAGGPSARSLAASPASSASPPKLSAESAPPNGAAPSAGKPEHALPADSALRPADSTGGSLPMKPSTGAVQVALGAVMSGARHCVAGDESASSAVVVFGSDGRVQSVTVQGPAAGKPSGACIESQLSRARVQPFAAASFSISATVRPD